MLSQAVSTTWTSVVRQWQPLAAAALPRAAAAATTAARPLSTGGKKKKKEPHPLAHKFIDGAALAQSTLEDINAQSLALFKKTNHRPGLGVLLVGDRKDSVTYTKKKGLAAIECGFNSFVHPMPEDATQEEVLDVLNAMEEDPHIDGVLVQLPLPPHLSQRKTLAAVSPRKDVDGFHPLSMGRLARHGEDMRRSSSDLFEPLQGALPCTPMGCVELLKYADVDVAGKHAVVIGHSNIVGLPMALMLLHLNATVTVLHAGTNQDDLPDLVRQGDIVVAAVGIPHFVQGEWLKPGAVVIDVGINFIDDPSRKTGKRMVGDVDTEAALPVVSRITPVPGGVGPMTVAMLMRNTLHAAENNWLPAGDKE